MPIIKIKKKHPDAVLPQLAYKSDAGYDLVAINDGVITGTYIEYSTGLSIEPEPGWHVEIFPRSSISKTDLMLANGIGLVDESYRGEIICRYKIVGRTGWRMSDGGGEYMPVIYKKGDKIAQLVIRKTQHVDFEWAEELSNSSRGLGGFGSSDIG